MSIKLLRDQKEEYLEHLFDLLYEPIMQTFQDIYNTVQKSSTQQNVLKNFQHELSKIPEWNQLQVEKAYTDIVKCNYFQKLLKTVYILTIKIVLLGIREDKRDTVKLKVPSGELFVHKCLIHVARELWKRPYLFYHLARSIERQNNLYHCEVILRKKIKAVIRETIPIEWVVDNMADMGMESDKESVEEEESQSESEPSRSGQSESESSSSEEQSESEESSVEEIQSDEDEVISRSESETCSRSSEPSRSGQSDTEQSQSEEQSDSESSSESSEKSPSEDSDSTSSSSPSEASYVKEEAMNEPNDVVTVTEVQTEPPISPELVQTQPEDPLPSDSESSDSEKVVPDTVQTIIEEPSPPSAPIEIIIPAPDPESKPIYITEPPKKHTSHHHRKKVAFF